MSEEKGEQDTLGQIALFFFGAWLLAKYLESKRKKEEFVSYKCWNCGYQFWDKGTPNCSNCGAHFHWGNPDTNSESPLKVKPPISPMISFVVFVATFIVILVCLFIDVKSPEAFETVKVICPISFGYSCGQR